IACIVQPVEQDGELIAAQSSDRVGRPQATFKPPRERDQQVVADTVTEAVVDVLEAVEINEEDGEQVVGAAARVLDGEAEVVEQERAIRQPRQRIVKGRMAEVLT